MPYIKQERRLNYDNLIKDLSVQLRVYNLDEGDINYVVSSLFKKLFEAEKSYKTINKLMGVLSCVQAEFYRRLAVPYENTKISENGDI